MNPIEMPGPGASKDEVIAFLSHQLAATLLHVKATDETETQISMRLQAQVSEQMQALRDSCDRKVAELGADANRWHELRKHLVKVRKLSLSAKGVELDLFVDRLMREAQH